MPAAPIDDYIRLTAEKRDLQAKVKKLDDQLEPIEAAVVAAFTAEGTQSVSRNGWTVYRSRDISVKSASGDTSDIVDKLRKARLGELIGIQWPKMKAYVKEKMYCKATDSWEVDLSKLPPSLREVVAVEEFYKLGCRKA